MSHSKEPWELARSENWNIPQAMESSGRVGTGERSGLLAIHSNGLEIDLEDEENLQRIVACVNACRYLAPEQIDEDYLRTCVRFYEAEHD